MLTANFNTGESPERFGCVADFPESLLCPTMTKSTCSRAYWRLHLNTFPEMTPDRISLTILVDAGRVDPGPSMSGLASEHFQLQRVG